ncbi:UNVERIFIED_CONTAM: hypothetical protein NCL1_60211 [Trichonephila clavipes]
MERNGLRSGIPAYPKVIFHHKITPIPFHNCRRRKEWLTFRVSQMLHGFFLVAIRRQSRLSTAGVWSRGGQFFPVSNSMKECGKDAFLAHEDEKEEAPMEGCQHASQGIQAIDAGHPRKKFRGPRDTHHKEKFEVQISPEGKNKEQSSNIYHLNQNNNYTHKASESRLKYENIS